MTSTRYVDGSEKVPVRTFTVIGTRSGTAPSRPAIPVLTSVSSTPMTFSGEPIFMLTLARG